MKISARNVLKGRVLSVLHGAVNSEIVLEIAVGLQVVSVITKVSAESLGLKPGDAAYAVVKSSDVLIAIE